MQDLMRVSFQMFDFFFGRRMFKIQVRQNPPLRFGPSKSRSVKIHPCNMVRQNPPLQYGPSKSRSVKIHLCDLVHQNPGPSKSTSAIWSIKIQVRQNPPLRYGPSKSSPANSAPPTHLPSCSHHQYLTYLITYSSAYLHNTYYKVVQPHTNPSLDRLTLRLSSL